MRIKYFIIALCYGLFAACSQSPNFPREETITQELMPLQGVTFPGVLEVKHPFLIVQNRKRTDSLFHIYNLNTYELAYVFGVTGQGPGEFLVGSSVIPTQLSELLIVDFNDGFKTYFWRIAEDGKPLLSTVKQPKYAEGLSAVISDSLYVMNDMFSFETYGLVNLSTFQSEEPIKSWRFSSAEFPSWAWFDLNYGQLYANESRIVFLYEYKKQIDFLDTDLNLINRVKFNYSHPAIITPNDTKEQSELKRSYTAGYLGKHYFYALFKGASWNEWHNNLSFRGSILEVFDLDGNPVIKYHLNGISPYTFVVDEETFTLYGRRDDNEPEDHLLVYRLKGLQ